MMTVVRVRAKVPVDGGEVAARGFVWWAPNRARVVPGAGSEASTIILPAEFKAALVDGAADVTVDPSGLGWAWCVLEAFQGFPSKRRYFTVPNVESVDYTDLVEIDPTTLAPAPAADPAWLAPFETLSAGTVTPDPDDPGFFLIGVL